MRLIADEAPWPSLAWLAECGSEDVRFRHGPGVEVREEAGFEAVWPGSFEAADFDREAIVAGSGVRLRDGTAAFVSSTSTVDRICSATTPAGCLVSNSLPCLLAHLDGDLVAGVNYRRLLGSIVKGIDAYETDVPTSAGPVRLTYYRNLVWDGSELSVVEKPPQELRLGSFADYRGYLAAGLAGIAANMSDPARRRGRFDFLATVSSGYDANALAALAAEHGCEHALGFDLNRTGERDSGEAVARVLGLHPLAVSRGGWRSEASRHLDKPEVPFLAASPRGGLTPFAAVHPELGGAVLLTGFYGDSIWGLDWRHLAPVIRRKDLSGLSLAEYRLQAGFIHCPPTFWAAREIADVAAISSSEEMSPWVTGERYQRPIPRRILEDAGIARDAFGVRKLPGVGSSLVAEKGFLTPRSLHDYLLWVRANRRKLGVPPVPLSPRADRARWLLAAAAESVGGAGRRRGLPGRRAWAGLQRWGRRQRQSGAYIRRWLHAWGVARAKEVYAPGEPEA